MTTSYRSSRSDQRIADDHLADFLPCSVCRAPTERATLTEYGARCGACFTRYVTGDRPLPPMPTREQRAEIVQRVKSLAIQGRPSRQWAYRMRDREEAGDELTRVQREAWRAALHGHDTLDAARDGADVPRGALTDALRATGDIPAPSDDEALWAARAADLEAERAAERQRLSADPRFAAWEAIAAEPGGEETEKAAHP